VHKAEEDELFTYLKELGRSDLIKDKIHWKTLTTFAKERLEKGKELPEFIKLSFKRVAKLIK